MKAQKRKIRKRFHCADCGHEWLSRLKRPKACPACGSVSYDKPQPPSIQEPTKEREQATAPMQKLIRAVDKALSLNPLEAFTETQPKEKPPKAKEPAAASVEEIKKAGGRRWWMVGVGVALIVLALFLATMWGQNRDNMLLALLTIMMLPGGALLAYRGFKKTDSGIIISPGSGEKITGPVNSLNIYPDRIAFTWLETPQGQPQQCLNDHQYYYVHIFDESSGNLKPFTLPDTRYRDPREFANVINLPANRRLLRRKVSLAQKIAPWALVVAMAIMGFIFIATAPPPGG